MTRTSRVGTSFTKDARSTGPTSWWPCRASFIEVRLGAADAVDVGVDVGVAEDGGLGVGVHGGVGDIVVGAVGLELGFDAVCTSLLSAKNPKRNPLFELQAMTLHPTTTLMSR